MDFFRDPIWQFIGVIVAIIGMIFALYIDRDKLSWKQSIPEGQRRKSLLEFPSVVSSKSAFLWGIAVASVSLLAIGYGLSAGDTFRVKGIVLTEIRGVTDRNLALLESLYLPDAIIIDHQHTLHESNDDLIYRGWEEIKQKHYMGLFSWPWSSFRPKGTKQTKSAM